MLPNLTKKHQIKKQSNPTRRTQESILKEIQNSKTPISLTALAERTKNNIYQVKSSVQFFNNLRLIDTIISSGGTTLVQIKKDFEKRSENAITNSTEEK